jgi:hypothetical protein
VQFILGAVAFFGVFVVEHADVAPHCTTARAEVVEHNMALGCFILFLRTTCTTCVETPPS